MAPPNTPPLKLHKFSIKVTLPNIYCAQIALGKTNRTQIVMIIKGGLIMETIKLMTI